MNNHPIDSIRVVEFWEQGYNYRETGEQFGVSRERIRQIVVASHKKNCQLPWIGPGEGIACGCISAHRSGRDRLRGEILAKHADAIKVEYLGGMPMKDIAQKHDLSAKDTHWFVEGFSAETKAIRNSNMWTANKTRGTNDLDKHIANINCLADKLGRVPTRAEYDREAALQGWRSAQTICIRFGYWSSAIKAAGLVPSKVTASVSKSRRDKHWNDEKVLDAMHYMYEAYGEIPPLTRYREIYKEVSWLPSDQMIRRGSGWPETRLLIMNTHDDWEPKFSTDELIPPARTGGRPKNTNTTEAAA